MLRRRDLLRAALACGAALALPSLPGGEAPAQPAPAPRWDRHLVLIELNGGNDGLNTVIPCGDPAYARLRPRIGIPRDQVLHLADGLGLHPALAPLMEAWTGGELAIALGLGYAHPNRSHFRGIDIWSSGSDADELLDEGWLARLYDGVAEPDGLVAHGLVLARPESDPLRGGRCRSLAMPDQGGLLRAAGKLAATRETVADPALAHVLRVQGEVRTAAQRLASQSAGAPDLAAAFPRHRLGRQCAAAARLIAARVQVPVLKLAHGSFDTHANQADQHRRLLAELAESLAALRSALAGAGAWDRVLVATYSEFGRRAAENASQGTDHGTAAPHILLGGGVRGGLLGTQPGLADLDGGDLRFTADYRRLWATAQAWLGLPGSLHAGGHRAFDCLG